MSMVQDMPTRKPFYKKLWFWACVIAVFIVLIAIANDNAPSSTAMVDQRCEAKYQLPDNQQRCKLEGYIKLRENM